MRRIYYIFAILCSLGIAFTSCEKELDFVESGHVDSVGEETPVGKVKVRFAVSAGTALEAELVDTKADTRDEDPHINTMHVAVFGSSGYLKQYVQAALVSAATQNYYDEDGKRFKYVYEVDLWITEKPVRVHFIGNGPSSLRFDYESNTIPELFISDTDAHTDGYWQRIEIPRGIRARTHSGDHYVDHNGKDVYDGDYIDNYDNLVTDGQYVVADETILAMSGGDANVGVRLIRNFAQVSVESRPIEDSNFQLISYTVVNEPRRGSIAPYKDHWLDYLSYTDHGGATNAYEELLAVYPGNEVEGNEYDTSVPAASAFSGTPDGKTIIGPGGNAYIYERPVPVSNPTSLIVYGKYQKGDMSPKYCYYKIDLMEKGVYLTLFRNFKYKVTIKHVNKPGKDTPLAAYQGAGSGDVSGDVDAQNLTDISDGDCQLYVTEMAPILVEQEDAYDALMYKFVYDVSAGDSALDNNYRTADQTWTGTASATVTGETQPGAGKPVAITFSEVGSGNVIESFTVEDNPEPSATNGYRHLYIKTKAPSTSTRTETFRITATYVTNPGLETERTHTLYRDIKFTLMNVQKLQVRCIPSEVQKLTGQGVTVRVTIPSGLPEAMFPLEFPIEIVNNSLTPDYNPAVLQGTGLSQNLPVTFGQTYQYTEQNGNKVRGTLNGYYFVRTLSYDEYMRRGTYASSPTVGSESQGTVYFDSYFKTVKDNPETAIFVGALPPTGADLKPKSFSYFEPNTCNLGSYIQRSFGWSTNYAAARFWEAGTEKELTFTYNPEDKPSEIYVTLSNLRAATTSPNLTGVDVGEGLYKVANIPDGGSVTIRVIVADRAGLEANVALSANHYVDNNACGGTIGRYKESPVVHTNTNTVTHTVERAFNRQDFDNTWEVTHQDVTLTLSNCVRGNNYISLGSENVSNNNYQSGLVNISGLPTDMEDSTTTSSGAVTTTIETTNPWISKVVFSYTAAGYADGNDPTFVPNNVGRYTRNQATGTWAWTTGTTTNTLTFTMPRSNTTTGNVLNRRYYAKRVTTITVTYSYDVTTITRTVGPETERQWVTTED